MKREDNPKERVLSWQDEKGNDVASTEKFDMSKPGDKDISTWTGLPGRALQDQSDNRGVMLVRETRTEQILAVGP